MAGFFETLKNIGNLNVTSPAFDSKVAGAVKYPFTKTASNLKVGAKYAAIGAAVLTGVYAASRIVNGIRNKREFKDDGLDVAPVPMDMPQEQYAMAGPQEATLMGMPMVEGSHAQRVLAGRGQGQAAGVDATSPEMEKDGRSTVDGRPVEDLGGIGM